MSSSGSVHTWSKLSAGERRTETPQMHNALHSRLTVKTFWVKTWQQFKDVLHATVRTSETTNLCCQSKWCGRKVLSKSASLACSFKNCKCSSHLLLNHTLEMMGVPSGSVVKTPHATQETQERQVWSLGWEDSPGGESGNNSSILAWKILWTEEPTVHRVTESQARPSTHRQAGLEMVTLGVTARVPVLLASAEPGSCSLHLFRVRHVGKFLARGLVVVQTLEPVLFIPLFISHIKAYSPYSSPYFQRAKKSLWLKI